MDSVHMQQTTFPGVFRHWELPKCYIVTCITCTYYTEGKEIFSEIFRHLLLPTYSVLAAKILPGILSSRWCNVCTQYMWKWYILTAVRAEILQVTSFWLRGNMCTQYMYVKVNYLAGCYCWTTRMIVIPPREYLHSIQVKITYFASSWYKKCMFDLLGTLCDLPGTLFDDLATLFDLLGPFPDFPRTLFDLLWTLSDLLGPSLHPPGTLSDLPRTLFDLLGTLFHDVLISHTRQLWIWLNRNNLNIIWNLLGTPEWDWWIWEAIQSFS